MVMVKKRVTNLLKKVYNFFSKNYWILLTIIFLSGFFLRVFLAKGYYFSNDESYFNIREIEKIRKSGIPFYYDNLSYSGRKVIVLPVFHYFMAFFRLFMPPYYTYFFIPKVIASFIAVVVFFVMKNLTRDKNSALFSSVAVAFMPLLFGETTNSVTSLPLSIILFLLAFLFFLQIKDKKFLLKYIISLFVLSLTSSTVLIFIGGLLLFLIFAASERLKNRKIFFEVGIFSTSLVIWIYLLIFKNAILLHGVRVFWQNTPTRLLSHYFSSVNLSLLLYSSGVFTFIAGLYILYKYLFRRKVVAVYLVSSVLLFSMFLLLLKLIDIKHGLIFVGIMMCLSSGFFYKEIMTGLRKTKFHRLEPLISAFLFLLILLSSLPLCFVYSSENLRSAPNEEVIKALRFLRNNTEEGAVVLARLKFGILINYFAERKNVIDSKFLLVEDANIRLEDVERFYKTVYEVEAIKIMNKYNATYAIFEDEKPVYLSDKKCFNKVYDGIIKIYKMKCKVE